ncbi:hypothetical protein O181_086314 [Austropuccinia psidii MF-1]|uniref:Uncharacterized protein n=1 Tax=Austropuccinia psidii MF-1 TaxID=1389203 RepID=A0A9Q3FWR5_9BASI|nr:hypothetical protein [Austropuccinia psidii MF-1]
MPTSLSVINFCFKIQHLWNRYLPTISTASKGFHLFLVLRSSPLKIGVLSQPWKRTPQIGFCGNSSLNQSMANWPYYKIMEKLGPGGVKWPLGHTYLSWPIVHLIRTQANPTELGPGGSLASLTHHLGLGVFGIHALFGPFRPHTASVGPFRPKGAKGLDLWVPKHKRGHLVPSWSTNPKGPN